MMELYAKYLDNIDETINQFFEQQKPYIFCKEGCSMCCEKGIYPFSELEFEYAMVGFNDLNDKEKEYIYLNVKRIKNEKKVHKGDEKFMHECPFLINKKCSIYNYRGLICRNHGLMYYSIDKSGKKFYSIPYCVSVGLNYSSVFDPVTGTISSEKWKNTGIVVEPVSHNVSPEFLRDNNTIRALGLHFGEEKALIDWFN